MNPSAIENRTFSADRFSIAMPKHTLNKPPYIGCLTTWYMPVETSLWLATGINKKDICSFISRIDVETNTNPDRKLINPAKRKIKLIMGWTPRNVRRTSMDVVATNSSPLFPTSPTWELRITLPTITSVPFRISDRTCWREDLSL